MDRPRPRHLFIVSVLALVASGCPSSRRGGDKAAPRDVPAGAAISGAPAVERLRAFYPPTLGKFYRVRIARYDGEGQDASVGYNYFRDGRETLVAFTAYFYPAPDGADDEDALDKAVRQAIREVKSKHRNVRVTGSEPAEVKRDGEPRQGRRVTFEYTDAFGAPGKRQKLMSELHVYPAAPGRLVKYRITYPAADADYVRGLLDPFVASFPWPSGL